MSNVEDKSTPHALPDGWKWARLGDVCEVIPGQSPPGSSYNSTGEGAEFHQGKAAFGDRFLNESGKWTTESRRYAEAGDIVISVRAPVGPVNLVDRSVAIGRGLATLRVKNGILVAEWLFHYMCNIESQLTGTQGSTFPSINKRQIEDILVPVAPLAEQLRILDSLEERLEAVEDARRSARSQLDALEELPDVYLRLALVGRLS